MKGLNQTDLIQISQVLKYQKINKTGELGAAYNNRQQA